MNFNVSSFAKTQQWRNDLLMNPSDPIPEPTDEVFNETPNETSPCHPGQAELLDHVGNLDLPGYSSLLSYPVRPSYPALPDHLGHSGQLGQPGHPGDASLAGQSGEGGGQMLANASVCCEQPNCKRIKLEHMPENYFQEAATPFAQMNPAQGRNQQAMKREAESPSGHEYVYCACGRGGQMVTICCNGRNCDNASKIDEGIHMGPSEVHACHSEGHRCPPDAQLAASDDDMGPPEEKRVRTSYNQY